MRLFIKIYILTVILNNISLASNTHPSPESEAVDSDTLSKGLARSTFDAEVIHHTVQSEVLKENNTQQHLPYFIGSSLYHVCGHIKTTYKIRKSKITSHGFGVLVGSSHVLTAAHNLYTHKDDDVTIETESGVLIDPVSINSWMCEAIFTPFSKTSTSEPLHIQAHTLLCPRLWVEKKDPLSDYGMIILEKPIGDTLGWAGFYRDEDDEKLLSISEITGTFLDYRQGLKHPPYFKQYKNHTIKVTPQEIFYSIMPRYETRGWGVLFRETENSGYLVVGFGSNKRLEWPPAVDSQLRELPVKKFLRLSPTIFDHLIRWLQGAYPSVDQEIALKTNKKRAGDPYDDPQAQFYLAEHYRNLPTPKWKKALRWYSNCLDHVEFNKSYKKQSHEKLGDYYYEIDKDIAFSMAHYKSAETPHSIYMLWKIYKEKGKYDRAQEWYMKITDQTYLKTIDQDSEWCAWQKIQKQF